MNVFEAIDAALQAPFDRAMWHLERRWSPPAVLREAKTAQMVTHAMVIVYMIVDAPPVGAVLLIGYLMGLANAVPKWKAFASGAARDYTAEMADRYARMALSSRHEYVWLRLCLVAFAIPFLAICLAILWLGVAVFSVVLGVAMVLSYTVFQYLESAVPSPPPPRRSFAQGLS